MPTRTRASLILSLVATAVFSFAAPSAGDPSETELEALELLDAAQGLDTLSDAVWPGWRISQTPFAIYIPDSTCYLVRHPQPPAGFDRCAGVLPVTVPVYTGDLNDAAIDLGARRVSDVPTAFMHVDEFRGEVLPKVFEKAFHVHLLKACRALCELPEPAIGYPINGQSLALVDIECDALAAAMAAADDSLARRVKDFVAVRSFRQSYTLGRFTDFERRIEFTEGMPLYIAERCREHASEHLGGVAQRLLGDSVGAPGGLQGCFVAPTRLSWYRRNRLRYSGAAVCMLLDSIRPGWQAECDDGCIDPYSLLVEAGGGGPPRVLGVLEKYHLKERMREREDFIGEAKTGPEREFERLMRGSGKRLVFTTNLLAAVSISHDPKTTSTIDSHREVHISVLKVEFSGGTHIHITGHQVAAMFGESDFDVRQLVMEMPEEYSVHSNGVEVVLEDGINHLDQEFVVEAPGLSVAARVAVVVVGENRLNFVLHQ